MLAVELLLLFNRSSSSSVVALEISRIAIQFGYIIASEQHYPYRCVFQFLTYYQMSQMTPYDGENRCANQQFSVCTEVKLWMNLCDVQDGWNRRFPG